MASRKAQSRGRLPMPLHVALAVGRLARNVFSPNVSVLNRRDGGCFATTVPTAQT